MANFNYVISKFEQDSILTMNKRYDAFNITEKMGHIFFEITCDSGYNCYCMANKTPYNCLTDWFILE